MHEQKINLCFNQLLDLFSVSRRNCNLPSVRSQWLHFSRLIAFASWKDIMLSLKIISDVGIRSRAFALLFCVIKKWTFYFRGARDGQSRKKWTFNYKIPRTEDISIMLRARRNIFDNMRS